MDDNFALLSIMEAVDRHLAEGFQPQRTIYLTLGHDEEVGGHNGAAKVAELLRSRNVELEYVLDEGLAIADGVLPDIAKPIALIGVANKGYRGTVSTLCVPLRSRRLGGFLFLAR